MPTYRYAANPDELDKARSAIASGREMHISPKHAREICNFIKGKKIDVAITMLEDVIAMKRSVPTKHHNKKAGHRSDLKGWYSGRYPVKASAHILEVARNLLANAENKHLNVDNCFITKAISHRGRKIKRFFPRAQGRSTPKYKTLTHIELVTEQLY